MPRKSVNYLLLKARSEARQAYSKLIRDPNLMSNLNGSVPYRQALEKRKAHLMTSKNDLKLLNNVELIHARQAVDMFVMPVLGTAGGGTNWTATAAMSKDLWGDKKRKGRTETSSVVLAAWLTYCNSKEIQTAVTRDTIETALKQVEEKARKHKEEAVEDKQKEIFDVQEWLKEEQKNYLETLEAEDKLIPQYIFNTEGKAGRDQEIIERWESGGSTSAFNAIKDRYRQHMTNKKPSIKYTDKDIDDKLSQMLGYIVTKGREKIRLKTAYDGNSQFEDFCKLFRPFYLTFMSPNRPYKPESEMLLDMASIYHTIWQIKRKLADATVSDHMVTILYGKGGIGKDEAFVPTILYPVHGWVRKYEDATHLADVERHGQAVWSYLVGYLEEMAVGRAEASTLKAVISTNDLQVRAFGQNKLVDTLKSKMTYLGSANEEFKKYSRDYTNSRRYCEIVLTLTQDELSDDIKEYRGSRDGDGKMRPGSWASRNSHDLWRMVDETKELSIYSQYPEINKTLLARQKAMTPSHPVCGDIELLGFHSKRVGSEHPHAVFHSLPRLIEKWQGKARSDRTVKMQTAEQITMILRFIFGEIQQRDGVQGYYLVQMKDPFDADVDNQIEQEYIEESTEGGFEW
jgi:hypothetical protein